MKLLNRLGLLAGFVLALALPASIADAQQPVVICAQGTLTGCTPASGTSPLPVTPAAPASGTVIGNVGGISKSVCVTPTITAATYTSVQPIGGLLNFAALFRATPLSGVMQSVTVTSKTVQTAGLTFYPLIDNPTASTFTDRTTAAINVADVPKVRAPVALNAAYSGLGTHTVWGAVGIGQATVSASTSLYGVLLPQATTSAFGSTSDIQVCVTVLLD